MAPRSEGSNYSSSTRVYADVVVLTLADSHYHSDSMAALAEALRDADAKARTGIVVVDLGAVVLLSSTALRALRAAHMALEARGGRIVAASGGELVRGVLKFAPFIAKYDTVRNALKAQSVEAAALFEGE